MLGTRYIQEGRKPLEVLLPLKSPLILFVDPSDKCCLKCSFCPSSNLELMKEVDRPLKIMDFDLFKKIVDDLQEFENKIKVVRLYGFGEPLLNKNFSNMVRYAKQSNKVEWVDTTTNGLLFNKQRNLEIIDSGIDRINISVNGINEEQYEKFTHTKIDFQKYVKNIKHLYDNRKQCYIFIKINGDTISKEDEQKFLNIFEPIADSAAVERSFNCWNNFEAQGFVKGDKNIGIYGQEIKKEVLVCPYPEYSIAINSDLTVSQCFLDWNRKMIIGDANKESIYDIWHGEKFKEFQEMMLRGERKNHFYCKDCNQVKGGNPSDIDDYAEEILKKRKEGNYI